VCIHHNSATGLGTALDAVSRGLSVALVERDDFASGRFFRDHCSILELN